MLVSVHACIMHGIIWIMQMGDELICQKDQWSENNTKVGDPQIYQFTKERGSEKYLYYKEEICCICTPKGNYFFCNAAE